LKKIIHIASDEKFINSAYWQFNEVFPNQNIFYLLVDNTNQELKHVQLNSNFFLIKNDLKNLRKLVESLLKEGFICFHGLNFHSSFLLNKLGDNCRIFWFLWGSEVYNNSELVEQKSLYGDFTFSYFFKISKKEKFIEFLKNNIRQSYYKLIFGTDSPQKLIYKAIKRVDYCAILYIEEFNFINEKIKTDIKFLKFSYYPIERMIRNENVRIKADNILLGNSASETNNHLEAFELLNNFHLKERKIIVPLSYGKTEYADEIIKVGEKLFNDNFIPLIDFMPLHDYNEYIEQCGIVIMNHYRQQAVGNVLTMLWMGAKVYLDERNTLYHYLNRIGVHVFSIQTELHNDNPEVFSLLSIEDQDNNRHILKNEIGQNLLLKKLREQLIPIVNES
jgi:hypothetical protein